MEIPSISPSEGQTQRTLSFTPQDDQTTYPQISPGLYIYVQDKVSKEVFPMPSQSGHGHPFCANRVNQAFQRKKDDFSWLGTAGEMLVGYGGVLLGRSRRTGYFHDMLDLTEPENPDAKWQAAQDGMPQDLYYTVSEWEMAISAKCRALVFRSHGGFQKASASELAKIQRYLKLDDPSNHPVRVFNLLRDIIATVNQITQMETLDLSRKKTLSSCKAGHFYHAAEGKKAEAGMALELPAPFPPRS